MDRREFIRLSVMIAVGTQLPLAQACSEVHAQHPSYTDDLIIRMYEDGNVVRVETRRWFTVREAVEIKETWAKTIKGLDYEKRDLIIKTLTDIRPLNPKYEPLCGNVRVCTLCPSAEVESKWSWIDEYAEI